MERPTVALTPLTLVALLALSACGGDEPVTDPQRLGATRQPAARLDDEGEAAPAEEAPAEEAGDDEAARAPDRFTVRLDTTQGNIDIEVHRDWAPRGADRFHELVQAGYFRDLAFFRVIEGFMAQTGISGDPALNERWRNRRIQDDPVRQSNTRGMVSFATSGPNSRTTQFFINFGDNSNLDGMGFSPFGRVREMAPVDRLYSGYGEGAPRGRGPSQGRIQSEGNAYLRAEFPELDYIRSASIVGGE